MAKYSKRAKQAAKTAKKHPVLVGVIVIILVLLIAAIALLWYLRPDIFHNYIGVGAHSYGEWQTVTPATCTEGGKKVQKCSCGEERFEDIPATGHGYGEWQIENADRVPCEDIIKYRVCGSCQNRETDIIPSDVDHVFGEWQITKEPTCANGLKVRVCEKCNAEDSEVIPAVSEHNFGDGTTCTVCGFVMEQQGPEAIKSAELSIHFLELGNKYTGDSTLIKCGNTEVLIDAGSRQNSAATINQYVSEYCTDGVLEYVIATHAHQDHIAGFVGNSSSGKYNGVLYSNKIGTLIQFAGHNSSSGIYTKYCTAVEYAQSQGTAIYTAKQCWDKTDGAQRVYYLDEAQTVSMNILYNYYYDHETDDENDYSVCMLLTQQTADGEKNYLFTGDLEAKGESYLVDNNDLPEVELFKGGHHGSYTASTEKLLSRIKPKNIAVCCCCGTTEYTSNPQNTFPAQAFIDRVCKYTENIYCTTLMIDYKNGKYESLNGNIVFYTKGGRLNLWCSNNTVKLKDTEWFKANRVWNA